MTLQNKDGLEVLVHRLVAVDGRVHYLSMGGGREEVEAVWGALADWGSVYLKGIKEPLRRGWDELRYRSARIGPVYHGLVVSRLVGSLVLVWQEEEAAAKKLAQVLGVPVLPAWVPFLIQAVEELRPQKEVLAVGTRALVLDRGTALKVREALQEALRKGLLPLPEEVLAR